MTDINDLVQEFSGTSCDIWVSFFAMRRLFGVLQGCFVVLEHEVCFDIIYVFATALDL